MLSRDDYQFADLAGDPAEARAALSDACRRLDAEGEQVWSGGSPFPGLRPLDAGLRRAFFGRRAEVGDLLRRLRTPDPADERALLLVVGPSGCGKSSLVRAGLAPAAAAEPGWWGLPPMVPGAEPTTALASALALAGRGVGLHWTLDQVVGRLAGSDGLAVLAGDLLLAAPGPGHRNRLLVVVDQCEELLTQVSPEGRSRFARLLPAAMAGPVRVVATVRPEFLGRLLAEPDLASLPTRTFTVLPLRREALAAVIEGPARLADIEVDDELVVRLVADTDSGAALPLLAFTLARLAEGVSAGGQLSIERYERLGGVAGAIEGQAEAALADARAAGGRTDAQILAGLLTLVSVDEDGRPSRRRVHEDDLPEVGRKELYAFVARRLVTTDSDVLGPGTGPGSGGTVLSVAHEAFLSAWPPLAAAVSAAATGLRARRAVEVAAQDWVAADRPSSQLWERGQLAVAVNALGARRSAWSRWWRPGARRVVTDVIEVSSVAREFLRTSMRRDRRRRRRALTSLSTLLALAVVAAGVAEAQRRVAQEHQRTAVPRLLVVQADAVRNSDRRTRSLGSVRRPGSTAWRSPRMDGSSSGVVPVAR